MNVFVYVVLMINFKDACGIYYDDKKIDWNKRTAKGNTDTIYYQKIRKEQEKKKVEGIIQIKH